MVEIISRENTMQKPPLVKQAYRKLQHTIVRSGIIPGPLVLNIFTTNRCNFSCFYCSRNVEDDAPGVIHKYGDQSEFHIDDLKLLLDRYPTIRTVSFVGVGEPFLIKDLIPMAKLAKQRGKSTRVISNGSLLHKHWGEIAPNFDHISISLHGLTAEELTAIALVKEKVFNQFIDNFHYLLEHERKLNPAMEVRSSVVVLKSNLERVRQAARFCAENHIPILELQNYLPVGLDDSNECIFDNETEYIDFVDQLIEEYRGTVQIVPPVYVKSDDKALKWGCTTYFDTLRVDGLGQVTGCTRIMVPLAENGNFRQDPNVWRNEYFTDMRRRFRESKDLPECCRFCPAAQ